MKPTTLTMTPATAEVLRQVINEFIRQRTPVREYVDNRYAHMDEAFRNFKIGSVQARIDRMDNLLVQLKGETK